MHEIITLQLGQRSNYLATHFWNTQESYFTYAGEEESPVDHDVHFRPGVGADGSETFTPRTVIYDLKGGFGSLRKVNALYELDEDRAPSSGAWGGTPLVRPQPPIEPSPYQVALESGIEPPELTKEAVRYWSDFNRVYFHPRSIVQLNEYELNSSLVPFENWSTGEELFDNLDKEHDLLDRDVRPFAEEADQMQGFQIMASVDDAWGGFAAKYMDRLRDEYGKTAMWVFGIEDSIKSVPRAKQFLNLSNTSRSISGITEHASLYVPLSMPQGPLPSYLDIDPSSLWHTSALFSTAVETMTLPTRLRRLKHGGQSMDELGAALNVNGSQHIARLQMSIEKDQKDDADDTPQKVHTISASRDERIRHDDTNQGGTDGSVTSFDLDFFPTEDALPLLSRGQNRSPKTAHTFGQVESSRGYKDTASPEDDDFDGMQRAKRRAAGLPIIHKSRTTLQFPQLDSFPKIFDRSSSSLSVRSALSTDTLISSRIKNLRNIVNRSIAIDEREALSNSLGEIAEQYEEGWDSGSDSDDD